MVEKYKSREEYEEEVISRSKLPKGFKVGVVPLTFFPIEKKVDKALPMKLSLILLDNDSESFGSVFTKNSFPGHPVVHGKKMLDSETTRGVLINNKISNVRCSSGAESIDNILSSLSENLNIKGQKFFSSSTGIIGWKLPQEDIISSIPKLIESLNSNSIFPVAKGIMTTDNYPKVRSIEIQGGRITAVAKGAGMIEPNMATMLVFILTDIAVERVELRSILKRVVDKTFNRISIDSDQSTSDTAMIFSSNIIQGVKPSLFEDSLYSICLDLCQDVVRNGEGTAHVIQVTVKGVQCEEDALKIGKAIINAPLLKAAIYGNDPNLGRLLQAIGDVAGNENIPLDPECITLYMGEYIIYDNGAFTLNEELELKLNRYLKDRSFNETAIGFPEHRNNVEIVVDLQNGLESATVYGSDLSYEYVRENADYRS